MSTHTDSLLQRLDEVRADALRFGALDVALTCHDARLVLLHMGHLINELRGQLVASYGEEARLRRRVTDQVQIIRSLRADTDPAHIECPVERDADQIPRHGCG